MASALLEMEPEVDSLATRELPTDALYEVVDGQVVELPEMGAIQVKFVCVLSVGSG